MNLLRDNSFGLLAVIFMLIGLVRTTRGESGTAFIALGAAFIAIGAAQRAKKKSNDDARR